MLLSPGHKRFILNAIALYMTSKVRRRIKSIKGVSSAFPWKGLSDLTKKIRTMEPRKAYWHGDRESILFETGLLYDSIHSAVSENGVVVYVADNPPRAPWGVSTGIKARILQYGGTVYNPKLERNVEIPARPYMVIDEDDAEMIVSILRRYMARVHVGENLNVGYFD